MNEGILQQATTKLVNFIFSTPMQKQDYIFHIHGFLSEIITKISDDSVAKYRKALSNSKQILRKQEEQFKAEAFERLDNYFYEK